MDEIPQDQNTQAPSNQPSIEAPKTRGPVRKMLDTSSWFVLFTFLPVTVLILLSQNAIPGDIFYPIKRSMENVVLAAASVSPTTRVAFRTDLTGRRFDEAEKLLLARSDTTGLSDFIAELQTTQQEVAVLSSTEEKNVSTEKLIKKIDEYQAKLVQVQAQTQTQNNAVTPSLPTNTPIPSSAPIPTITLLPTTQLETTPTPVINITAVSVKNPTAAPSIKPSPTKAPTNTPSPTPTPITHQITPTAPTRISPSPMPSIKPSINPTTIPSPTKVQIQPSPTTVPTPSGDKVSDAIGDTRRQLDEIRRHLEEERKKKGKAEERERQSKETKPENLDKKKN